MKITHSRAIHIFARVFALLLGSLWILGCTSSFERSPVPAEHSDDANIAGIPDARIWGDRPPVLIQRWLEESSDEEFEARFSGISKTDHNYLAISGGGARGAFAAGVLVGWSETGTRPEFTIVTGVSAGALTAPFAFLGPNYDVLLEEISTKYGTSDILQKRSKSTAIWRDSVAGSDPLRNLIASYVDTNMVEAIAREHSKGRRLYVGTTNLDAGRPVLWNIGAIAASGENDKLELIRNVMLASASIPGVLPPIYFKVKANGDYYDELHADGGTTTQVNLYPVGFDWQSVTDRFDLDAPPNIYVIRNAKLEPLYKPVQPKLLSIINRSIGSLIRTQGIGDMYRIYIGAIRDEMNYHLAYIPTEFSAESNEMFDPNYMGALFEYGRMLARNGSVWHDAPPGVKSRKN